MAKEIDGQPDRQHKMLPPAKVGNENGVDLPSFGMSNFMDMANSEQVKMLLKNMKDGKVKLPSPVRIASVVSSEPVPQATSAELMSQVNQDNQYSLVYSGIDNPSVSALPAMESSQEAGQEEGEVVICVEANEYMDQNIYDPSFPFTAGRTEPIATTSTVDTSQLDIAHITEIGDNALFGESAENMMTDDLPSLIVKVNRYSRYRYQSERNTQNKRPRQYDMDEDKRCLAEVMLKGYIGKAKVIAHCVNRDGKLHPYSLYGNNCNHGVFVQMVDYSHRRSLLKLLKVSITTPKAKEYQNSIQEQQRYLEELNVLTSEEIPAKGTDFGDKQVVYLKVRVILEDRQIVLEEISTEIRNKKEGTEFKIRNVIPCWAPVAGSCKGNPDKTRVMVIVTDNTAFPNPKDVCIVFRKVLPDGNKWTRVLEESHIEIIRKTVVEFTPPAFRMPDHTEDVEVELILKDKKTGQETEPVIFTYKGIDEYGVMSKGKKRKYDTLSQEMVDFDKDSAQARERKMLQAIRKRTVANKDDQAGSSSSESSDSSPDNSLVQDQISSNHRQSVGDPEISIGSMRQSRAMTAGSGATATVTTTSVNPSQGPTQQTPQVAQSMMGASLPAFSTIGSNLGLPIQGANPVPGAQASINPGLEALLAQIVIAQAARNQGPCQQQAEGGTLSSLDLLSLVGQLSQIKSQAQTTTAQPTPAPVTVQPQPTVAPVQPPPVQVQSIPAPVVSAQPSMPPQPVIDPTVKLPKLKSNQMLAVINGQIVIINDDTVEAPGDEQYVGGSNMQQQQQSAAGGSNLAQAGLQYQQQGNHVQPNQSYVVTQGNQMVPNQYRYQQNPAMTTAAAGNQSVYIQQGQGQNSIPSSSSSTVPWYRYGERLEDDDLEIDSGVNTVTDNEKKVKRYKADKTETVRKTKDKAESADSAKSYMNLPNVIADVSDDSEENDEKKVVIISDNGDETVLYVTSESDEEADKMQS